MFYVILVYVSLQFLLSVCLCGWHTQHVDEPMCMMMRLQEFSFALIHKCLLQYGDALVRVCAMHSNSNLNHRHTLCMSGVASHEYSHVQVYRPSLPFGTVDQVNPSVHGKSQEAKANHESVLPQTPSLNGIATHQMMPERMCKSD